MNVTDKITITNEDNMLLMARYPDNYFDLAIVDPPYGISYRINLRKFLLAESKKHSINSRKFQNIIDELERLAIEIRELENKKSEYLNLNNL